MLIEFKTRNFKSIRDEICLSAIPSLKDHSVPGALLEREIPGFDHRQFLAGGVFVGANASGKSNILEAIRELRDLVLYSYQNEADEVMDIPAFKLDTESKNDSTEFEITFEASGDLYVYYVHANQVQILEETLETKKKDGNRKNLFNRVWSEELSKYRTRYNKELKVHIGKASERKRNALILSIEGHSENPELMPVRDWFRKKLKFLDFSHGERVGPFKTADYIDDPEFKNLVVDYLKLADDKIVDVKVEKREVDLTPMEEHFKPEYLEKLKKQGIGSSLVISTLRTSANDEPISFDLRTEHSQGTERYFCLIGSLIQALVEGSVLCVDEIETSLHPSLVRAIVELFFSKNSNKHGSQLFFSTHNPVLLDLELIRRDMIWIVEKNEDGATSLCSLNEIKVRSDEAVLRGYLSGRYGGVPILDTTKLYG